MAVYAVIALAYRHVPLEIIPAVAVYFPLSRIRLRWLKPPSEAVYIAIIVGAIAHGGLKRGEITMMAMQFSTMRILMDMSHTPPKKRSRLSRLGLIILRVLIAALAAALLWLIICFSLELL